jgi:metal-responsive CopG/Arc/MetJ family transcriptional regulator
MARMGRPPVDSETVGVRLQRHLIEGIDELRRLEPDLPNRQEMIRRILEKEIVARLGNADSSAS